MEASLLLQKMKKVKIFFLCSLKITGAKIKLALIAISLTANLLFSESPLNNFKIELKSDEDNLFLRRIAEFWEEKEEKLIESEVTNYLEKPNLDPAFRDYLNAFLGEIACSKEDFERAVNLFELIKSQEILEKVFVNFLSSLYELKRYDKIVEKGESFLTKERSSCDSVRQEVMLLIVDALYELSNKEEANNKISFAKRAKEYLDQITLDTFADQVKERLALTLPILGDLKGGVDLYYFLANKREEMREEYLFRAALLQSKFNKEKAIETFGQVCDIGSAKVKEAAYNRLILLLETEHYADLILIKDKLVGSIPEDREPLLHFFFGKSYFALKDYKRAAIELKLYLEGENNTQRKNALLILCSCAENLKDLPLFDYAIEKFEKFLPEDKELLSALFSRGILCKEKGLFVLAEKDFKKLLLSKDFNNREGVLYEYGALLYKINSAVLARDKFALLLKEFPNSQMAPLIWRYLITASIKSVELTTKEKITERREILLKDIKSFLDQKEIVTIREREDLGLIAAETKYELGLFNEALSSVLQLMDEIPSTTKRGDVNLLLSFCYKEGKKDADEFCRFAEKALILDPNLAQKKQVHLYLFNAYLRGDVNKAAEHLYAAFSCGKNEIEEHLNWLADFYYKKSSVDLLAKNRATTVLEKIVPEKFEIDEKNLFLESKIVALASLYNLNEQWDKALKLLTPLFQEYENKKLPFIAKEQAYLELGVALQNKKEIEKAKNYYEKLLSFASKGSPFACRAALNCARLLIAGRDLNKESSYILRALSLFKELSIQKRLENEPLHLEAAFEYIDLQTALENENKMSKRLLLLQRCKDNFSLHDDILSKDYHEALKRSVDKKRIFEAYMLTLEAEISLAKAQIAIGDGKNPHPFLQESSIIIDKIKKDIPTFFIHSRIEKIENELHAAKAER